MRDPWCLQSGAGRPRPALPNSKIIGLLLPCNVSVYEKPDKHSVVADIAPLVAWDRRHQLRILHEVANNGRTSGPGAKPRLKCLVAAISNSGDGAPKQEVAAKRYHEDAESQRQVRARHAVRDQAPIRQGHVDLKQLGGPGGQSSKEKCGTTRSRSARGIRDGASIDQQSFLRRILRMVRVS
jgi:hypothetical protein